MASLGIVGKTESSTGQQKFTRLESRRCELITHILTNSVEVKHIDVEPNGAEPKVQQGKVSNGRLQSSFGALTNKNEEEPTSPKEVEDKATLDDGVIKKEDTNIEPEKIVDLEELTQQHEAVEFGSIWRDSTEWTCAYS